MFAPSWLRSFTHSVYRYLPRAKPHSKAPKEVCYTLKFKAVTISGRFPHKATKQSPKQQRGRYRKFLGKELYKKNLFPKGIQEARMSSFPPSSSLSPSRSLGYFSRPAHPGTYSVFQAVIINTSSCPARLRSSSSHALNLSGLPFFFFFFSNEHRRFQAPSWLRTGSK